MLQQLRWVRFSSPHGDFSFSILCRGYVSVKNNGFRPLTGISLFLYVRRFRRVFWKICFRPLTGISLFLWRQNGSNKKVSKVFVPSRGFLFFYILWIRKRNSRPFSSPHGDFSFSMNVWQNIWCFWFCFRPLTGISLFLLHGNFLLHPHWPSFRPLTGISLFLWCLWEHETCFLIVFVPSRGFLFFYPISYSPYKSRAIFIICGANIFKPSWGDPKKLDFYCVTDFVCYAFFMQPRG